MTTGRAEEATTTTGQLPDQEQKAQEAQRLEEERREEQAVIEAGGIAPPREPSPRPQPPPEVPPDIEPEKPEPEVEPFKPDFRKADPFEGATKQDFERESSMFVPTEANPLPPSLATEEGRQARQTVGAPLQEQFTFTVGIDTADPVEIQRSQDLVNLRRTNPDLFKTLEKKGIDEFNRELKALQEKQKKQIAVQRILQREDEKALARFREANRELPDGNFIDKDELKQVKKDNPALWRILILQGSDKANAFIEKENARIEKENKQIEEHNKIVARSEDALVKLQKAGVVEFADGKPGTVGEIAVDGAAYLRQNPKDIQTLAWAGYDSKTINKWQKFNDQNILPAFQAQVKQKRNELLKTVKPQLLETPDQLYVRVDGQARAEVLKTFSPELQDVIMRRQVVDVAGYIVPFVHTGSEWAYMDTKDKIISIGVETAAVLSIFYGPRIIKGGSRALKSLSIGKNGIKVIPTVKGLAEKAGVAGREMQKATAKLQKVTAKPSRIKVKARVEQVQAANKLEIAQRASLKADRLFLEKLSNTNAISPKDLRQLEKLSGIKGISRSIQDVSTATRKLDEAWNAYELLKKNNAAQLRRWSNFEGGRIKLKNGGFVEEGAAFDRSFSDWLEVQRKLQDSIQRVQNARIALEEALLRADSTLQVRFKYPPGAPEFKGFRLKIDDKKPKIDLQNVQDSIDDFLARKTPPKPGSTKPQVIQRTRIQIQEAEEAARRIRLSPEFGNPSVAQPQRYRIPKVKQSPPKPVVATVKKEKAKQEEAAKEKQNQETTRKQREKIAQRTLTKDKVMTSAVADVYFRQMERIISDNSLKIGSFAVTKIFNRIRGEHFNQIKSFDEIGVNEKQATQTLVKPVNAQNTVTKVIVQTDVIEKIKPKPITPKKAPPRLRFKLPKEEKKKKKPSLALRKGKITWKQRGVWYLIKWPYASKTDVSISKTPPAGAKVVLGPRTAFRTIQLVTGKAPDRRLFLDLGIQDVIINRPTRKPGKKGAIKFKLDRKQKTKGDISLKGIRA